MRAGGCTVGEVNEMILLEQVGSLDRLNSMALSHIFALSGGSAVESRLIKFYRENVHEFTV